MVTAAAMALPAARSGIVKYKINNNTLSTTMAQKLEGCAAQWWAR